MAKEEPYANEGSLVHDTFTFLNNKKYRLRSTKTLYDVLQDDVDSLALDCISHSVKDNQIENRSILFQFRKAKIIGFVFVDHADVVNVSLYAKDDIDLLIEIVKQAGNTGLLEELKQVKTGEIDNFPNMRPGHN